MALEIINKLNVDFHDAKYIQVNAKQYDKNSRFILITCYNQGKFFSIDKDSHYACIRYRKPDDLGIFNSCEITDDGKILVELSEQMLAVVGKCYADLVVINGSSVEIDIDTGKILMNDGSIVSTMPLCINVLEAVFDNTEIESSYEYDALNDLLIKANMNYEAVVDATKTYSNEASNKAKEASDSATLAQSYAIGETGIRPNEDADNAKYYYSQTRAISESLDGSFTPMGTIEFSQLSSVEKASGYMYHITDSFITDDTFKCGAGVSYPAGTNVYCTADGYWDCYIDGTLIVTDDGEGNVEIISSYDFVSTYETPDKLNQIVTQLQERIKVLEEQVVLGIVE